jgi:hypothetical protein
VKRISVSFPGWKDGANADLIVRDVANDLAILRVTEAAKVADSCRDLPLTSGFARDSARITLAKVFLSPLVL